MWGNCGLDRQRKPWGTQAGCVWGGASPWACWPFIPPSAVSPALPGQPISSSFPMFTACPLCVSSRQTTALSPAGLSLDGLGGRAFCAIPNMWLLHELDFLFWGPGGWILPKNIPGFIWGKCEKGKFCPSFHFTLVTIFFFLSWYYSNASAFLPFKILLIDPLLCTWSCALCWAYRDNMLDVFNW